MKNLVITPNMANHFYSSFDGRLIETNYFALYRGRLLYRRDKNSAWIVDNGADMLRGYNFSRKNLQTIKKCDIIESKPTADDLYTYPKNVAIRFFGFDK